MSLCRDCALTCVLNTAGKARSKEWQKAGDQAEDEIKVRQDEKLTENIRFEPNTALGLSFSPGSFSLNVSHKNERKCFKERETEMIFV